MFNVWIPDWEMECCGEPFAIGDFVQWPAVSVDRSDWLERLFQGTRIVVHYSYGAHGNDGDHTLIIRQVAGRVDRIDAVTSAVDRTPIDAIGDLIEIAEGQATRHPISRVHRRPPMESTETSEFVGYLVTLDAG